MIDEPKQLKLGYSADPVTIRSEAEAKMEVDFLREAYSLGWFTHMSYSSHSGIGFQDVVNENTLDSCLDEILIHAKKGDLPSTYRLGLVFSK